MIHGSAPAVAPPVLPGPSTFLIHRRHLLLPSRVPRAPSPFTAPTSTIGGQAKKRSRPFSPGGDDPAEMSTTRPDHRRHHPLFLRNLSSPVSSSVRLPPASMRREIQASTPPPPHPLLSLDDLSHHSPSPQPPTPPRATMTPSPPPPRAGLFSSPLRSNGSPAPAAWWSPSREEKARDGSPVHGVVHQQQSPTTASGQQSQQQVALITLPPPREVARPEMPRDSVPAAGQVDDEEWVTVFGEWGLLLANSLYRPPLEEFTHQL